MSVMVVFNLRSQIRLIFLVCLMPLYSFDSFSETTVEVEVRVMSDDYKKPLEGASIKVEENGATIKTIYTDKRGYAKFSLPTGKLYWLRINSKGLITKIAEINAVVANSADLPDQIFCLMECHLFATKCHEDFAFTESEPIIKFFLAKDYQFDYDQKYTQKQLIRLKRLEENCDDNLEHDIRSESPILSKLEKAAVGTVVIITGTIQAISEYDRPGAPAYNADGKRWRLNYFKRQVH